MKKLISLISTKGKSTEQIGKEAWEAFKKYNQVNEKATKTLEEKQWRELLEMAIARGEQIKLEKAKNNGKKE